MSFGSPEFVLAIIGMAMFAGVLKSWGRARHGMADPAPHGHQRRGGGRQQEQAAEALRAENARLRERLELHENRLIALEAIVTDSGFDLARQIEGLRERPAARIAAGQDRTRG